jgi:hypothetical protein
MAPCAALLASEGADAQPALCLVDGATGKKEACLLPHTPDALDAWATASRTRGAGQPRAGCLEPARGPLISALLKDAGLVLSPRPPATLAQSRDAVAPSRATAEPREADALLARLRPQRDRLKAWRPAKATPRTRHERGASSRRLVHDRTRLSQRLRALWPAYFPQGFPWCEDIRTPRVCEGLRRWPAPRDTCCHAPPSGPQKPLSPRLAASNDAVPVTTAQAVLPASVLLITA